MISLFDASFVNQPSIMNTWRLKLKVALLSVIYRQEEIKKEFLLFELNQHSCNLVPLLLLLMDKVDQMT